MRNLLEGAVWMIFWDALVRAFILLSLVGMHVKFIRSFLSRVPNRQIAAALQPLGDL